MNKTRMPIVFMNQVTSFEVITPERYSEWEEQLVHRVGLADLPSRELMGNPTVGASGGVQDCSDWWAAAPPQQFPNDRATVLEGRTTVMMFQPTEYEQISGEKLAEWEHTVTKRIGADMVARHKAAQRMATNFSCGGREADGSDWL